MKRFILTVISGLLPACLFLTSVSANENDAVKSMLIAAKATGMCGTFAQLTRFQESTQMPGGDEFIVRFLNTEAARLGKTLPQFMEECQVVVEIYNNFMAELEKP